MIEIDGAYGEGGGAVLRQALGMAAYAGRPVRVFNIRAGRPRPGLAPQHLRSVQAVGAVCGARVRGASLGSTELTFEPGEISAGSFRFDIGTAGSVTLLLQTLLLPCLTHAGEYEFELTGGTDVPWSPPVDYLIQVTLPALTAFGTCQVSVGRRGYYPRGGGLLQARLVGSRGAPPPVELVEPGRVTAIRGVSHAGRRLKERRVAERQADAADHLLRRLGHPVEIAIEHAEAADPGSGVTLWTEAEGGPRLGGSALGARGKPADEVGREAARALLDALGAEAAAVDRHLADQLVPFLAAAGGRLRAPEITEHVRSNLHVAEQVLGARFSVEGLEITAYR